MFESFGQQFMETENINIFIKHGKIKPITYDKI